jgi:hypothetical protein
VLSNQPFKRKALTFWSRSKSLVSATCSVQNSSQRQTATESPSNRTATKI